MGCYLIERVQNIHHESWLSYVRKAMEISRDYQGQMLWAQPIETIEGAQKWSWTVGIYFEDQNSAIKYYLSPEYKKIRNLRTFHAISEVRLVEGSALSGIYDQGYLVMGMPEVIDLGLYYEYSANNIAIMQANNINMTAMVRSFGCCILEGVPSRISRTVVYYFDSKDALLKWYYLKEYQENLLLRKAASLPGVQLGILPFNLHASILASDSVDQGDVIIYRKAA